MATEQSTLKSSSQMEKIRSVAMDILANRKARVGLGILVPVFLLSILAPVIAPYNPVEPHVVDRYAAPSATYLLGTDNLGRDLFSRVLYGGRTSLLLGVSATTMALVLGVPLGIVAGYKRGRTDELIMRVMDMVMSIPTLLLGILILAILPSNIWNVILAVGIVYAPRIARVVRSATLSVRDEEYIMAAEARDESDLYIMFREILPNVTSPIIVEASIRIGFAILVGTALSFLGLGAQPPYPDWGFMIAEARAHLAQTVWFALWPSFALSMTVFGFNILGDGLRDVLDPRATSRGEQ